MTPDTDTNALLASDPAGLVADILRQAARIRRLEADLADERAESKRLRGLLNRAAGMLIKTAARNLHLHIDAEGK